MNYVVIDLEMCRVPYRKVNSTYKIRTETIQIGAVLVNEDYEIVDRFSTYVKPQVGSISGYIRRLTGINSYLVKEAPAFKEAMESFMEWLPEEEMRFVSWSMADRKQIVEEAENKEMDLGILNDILENWIDAQAEFGQKLGKEKQFRLEEALIASDVYQEGSTHDGLDDAYNTAKLFIKLETEPEFKLNEIYRSAKEDELEHLSVTMGDLFAGLKVS